MLESTEIEKVDHYIYLGQQIRMDHELVDEIKRGTRAGRLECIWEHQRYHEK